MANPEAHRWIRTHRIEIDRHAGKWLAVTGEGVVDHDDDPNKLNKRIVKKKLNAVVFQAPGFREA